MEELMLIRQPGTVNSLEIPESSWPSYQQSGWMFIGPVPYPDPEGPWTILSGSTSGTVPDPEPEQKPKYKAHKRKDTQ
jgi:hypothetical protein